MTEAAPSGGAATHADLRRRSVRGVAWQSVGSGAVQLIQAGVAFLAAAIVGPQAFALWGVAAVVFNAQHLLSSLGLGPAMVRHSRDDVDEQALADTAVGATSLIALLGTGAAALAAPWISGLFALANRGEVTDVIRVAALIAGLTVAGQVMAAVLERSLQFDRRAIVDLIGIAVYAILAVGLLAAGVGIWSLLWARIAQTVTFLVASVVLSPIRPRVGRRYVDRGLLRGLVSFGGPLGVSAIFGVAFANADTIIVGRMHGDAALGKYSLAYSLALMAPTLATLTLGRVYFASISAAPPGSAARRAVVADLARLCVPLGVGTSLVLGLVVPPVVPHVFGRSWNGLAELMLPLGLYAGARFLAILVWVVAGAAGRSRQLLVNEAVSLGVALALVPLFGPSGAGGVALAFGLGQLGGVAVGAVAVRGDLTAVWKPAT